MKRVITAIRSGVKWNAQRGTVSKMARRHTILDIRERDGNICDGAIKKRGNKVNVRGEKRAERVEMFRLTNGGVVIPRILNFQLILCI